MNHDFHVLFAHSNNSSIFVICRESELKDITTLFAQDQFGAGSRAYSVKYHIKVFSLNPREVLSLIFAELVEERE